MLDESSRHSTRGVGHQALPAHRAASLRKDESVQLRRSAAKPNYKIRIAKSISVSIAPSQ
jgi:hypothetical protein